MTKKFMNKIILNIFIRYNLNWLTGKNLKWLTLTKNWVTFKR